MNENLTPQIRLGIDIGRVLIDGAAHPDGGDTAFFTGDHLRTPPMAGAFDVLPRLVERFGGQAWLISKCGPRVQARTREWLAHHRFAERAGIPDGNLRFCLRRPEKAGICAGLGITHMVDDRADIPATLDGVVPHRFLFGPQPGPPGPGVVHVPTWADAEAAILATLAARGQTACAPGRTRGCRA
jgi:hypothetical protein